MTPRRRRLWWALGPLVLLVVAFVAAFTVSALSVQRNLRDARVAVGGLRAALLDRGTTPAEVSADLQRVQAAAKAADDAASGPLWGVPAAVPLLGRPLRTVRGAASAVDQLARIVLPDLAAAQRTLLTGSLHTAAGGVRLAPIVAAQQPLARADAQTGQILAQIQALQHSIIGPVDQGRRQLLAQVQGLAGQLHAADTAVRLLPPMLGADGPRRYFLGFENNAEARGLGGLPGAYAIVRADQGKITFEKFGNDTDFGGVHVSAADFGPDFLAHYAGAGPQDIFVNSDYSPHFPYAAKLWMRYWQAKTGEKLDGAIATDPTALSYLLAVTGPTTLADGTAVSASNVVALTESLAYTRFTDTARRKQFFIDVAKAVADDVLKRGPAKDTTLAKSLARAVGERRMLVWSARPDEEQLLSGEPIAGLLPDTSAPFASVVINSASGSKVDYYFDRDVRYTGPSCSGRVRTSSVTVRLTNNAPTSGLSDYVANRVDNPPPGTPRGSERLQIGVYATKGALLASATLDGKQEFLTVNQELGRPVYTAFLEIAPQTARTLVLYLVEPATARGIPSTIVQPLVRPQHTQLPSRGC